LPGACGFGVERFSDFELMRGAGGDGKIDFEFVFYFDGAATNLYGSDA